MKVLVVARLDTTIDYTTMPVRLIDQTTGKITSLTLTVNWSPRSAGDDNSNPFPSFVSQDGQYVLYNGNYYACIKTLSSGSILPRTAGKQLQRSCFRSSLDF